MFLITVIYFGASVHTGSVDLIGMGWSNAHVQLDNEHEVIQTLASNVL